MCIMSTNSDDRTGGRSFNFDIHTSAITGLQPLTNWFFDAPFFTIHESQITSD